MRNFTSAINSAVTSGNCRLRPFIRLRSNEVVTAVHSNTEYRVQYDKMTEISTDDLINNSLTINESTSGDCLFGKVATQTFTFSTTPLSDRTFTWQWYGAPGYHPTTEPGTFTAFDYNFKGRIVELNCYIDYLDSNNTVITGNTAQLLGIYIITEVHKSKDQWSFTCVDPLSASELMDTNISLTEGANSTLGAIVTKVIGKLNNTSLAPDLTTIKTHLLDMPNATTGTLASNFLTSMVVYKERISNFNSSNKKAKEMLANLVEITGKTLAVNRTFTSQDDPLYFTNPVVLGPPRSTITVIDTFTKFTGNTDATVPFSSWTSAQQTSGVDYIVNSDNALDIDLDGIGYQVNASQILREGDSYSYTDPDIGAVSVDGLSTTIYNSFIRRAVNSSKYRARYYRTTANPLTLRNYIVNEANGTAHSQYEYYSAPYRPTLTVSGSKNCLIPLLTPLNDSPSLAKLEIAHCGFCENVPLYNSNVKLGNDFLLQVGDSFLVYLPGHSVPFPCLVSSCNWTINSGFTVESKITTGSEILI